MPVQGTNGTYGGAYTVIITENNLGITTSIANGVQVVASGTSISSSNFLNLSNSAWGGSLNMPVQGTNGTYGGAYTVLISQNNLGITTFIANGDPVVILGSNSVTSSMNCTWGVGCSTTSNVNLVANNISCIASGKKRVRSPSL